MKWTHYHRLDSCGDSPDKGVAVNASPQTVNMMRVEMGAGPPQPGFPVSTV